MIEIIAWYVQDFWNYNDVIFSCGILLSLQARRDEAGEKSHNWSVSAQLFEK